VKTSFRVILVAAVLLAPLAAAHGQQVADPRVADIVRTGKVRVGMHLPQFAKDPATGEIHGNGTGAVIEPVARALATRLGVTLELVGNPSPPALIKCLDGDACDVGFLGFVRSRVNDVGYTAPYIIVPFTFMVPAGSSVHSAADVDKPGIRIAAVRSHASTLALKRIVKTAEIVEVEIPDQAFELVKAARADAWASPRPPLLEYQPKLAGSRVLDDHYGANRQAMAVPKARADRLAYITAFVEEAKTSGLVQRAIDAVGERGIEVAPAGVPAITGSVSGPTNK
jgi:polar amino acid transport system substrate-binding protein